MESSERLRENARITLEISCLARAGESVLILTDRKRGAYTGALASAARELGAIPVILDLTHYRRMSSDLPDGEGPVLEPVKAAVESADVVVSVASPRYDRLLGDPDAHDQSLTAERRRVYLMSNGLEEWEITRDEVAAIRRRTYWLIDLLASSETVRVTSPAGTDFAFGLGPGSKYVPILGIVPLYGEVAVTPRQGTESGVYVVDGPTQMGVRPADELDREPLRIVVEAGRVKETGGEATQLGRLREFIAGGDPPADAIDEVGILTTRIEANDEYWWSDGTHHHDRLHIALGNNSRRDALVHGPCHMDGEVCRPTVQVDGRAVVRDGVFLDELMEGS